MNPDTYTFSGDAVTFLGLVGVASTLLIVVTAFRRFFNSPYNVRYAKPKDGMTPWGHSDFEYHVMNSNESTSSDSGTDSADCT
jgi:hypothetical protein